jgi:hypothetical protein
MEILETVKREWGVLSEAPWSFVSLVFVVGLVVAGFVKYLDSTSLSGKDSTIENIKSRTVMKSRGMGEG